MSRYCWRDTPEPKLGEGTETGEYIQQLAIKLWRPVKRGGVMSAVEMDGFAAAKYATRQ